MLKSCTDDRRLLASHYSKGKGFSILAVFRRMHMVRVKMKAVLTITYSNNKAMILY